MYLPIISAILAIIAFNTSWNFLILVALAPFFWFLIQEQKFWKLLAGTALFRLIFAIGTVYFVIDPFLYSLSILIFLGLPISFYLIRRYWSSEVVVWSLPVLWVVWDYLEAQYTLLPMTIMMLGNPLANSSFLGLSRFGGIIGLTFFAALINFLITLLVRIRHEKKKLFAAALFLIIILFGAELGSAYLIKQNQEAYFTKKNFLRLEILSADKVKLSRDNLIAALSVKKDADLLLIPENFYRSNLKNWEDLMKFYQQIAKTIKVPISAVTLRQDGKATYKTNVLFSGNGVRMDQYDKNRLTITSEYWPLGNWRPFYLQPKFDSDYSIGKAVFDSAYQHQSGRTKIISLEKFSFASLICIEFHYPGYLTLLNEFNPDFISHNSNNDWISFGIGQYLFLTNNLRKIEAVHFKKPIVVNGIRDYAGVFYPDGSSELVYPQNGFSLVNAEVRF